MAVFELTVEEYDNMGHVETSHRKKRRNDTEADEAPCLATYTCGSWDEFFCCQGFAFGFCTDSYFMCTSLDRKYENAAVFREVGIDIVPVVKGFSKRHSLTKA